MLLLNGSLSRVNVAISSDDAITARRSRPDTLEGRRTHNTGHF